MLAIKNLNDWSKSFSFWMLLSFTFSLIGIDFLTMYLYIKFGYAEFTQIPEKYYYLIVLTYLLPICLIVLRLFCLEKIEYIVSSKKIDALGVSFCIIMTTILLGYFYANDMHLWYNDHMKSSLGFIYLVSIIYIIIILFILISDFIEYKLCAGVKKN